MLGRGLESLIPPSGSSNNSRDNDKEESDTRGFRHVGEMDKGVGPLGQRPEMVKSSQFLKEKSEEDSSSSQTIPRAKDGPLDAAPTSARVSAGEQNKQTIFQIEIDKVKPNPHQPRRDFNDEVLGELAASIREFGILQPLVVTKIEVDIPTGRDVEYTLIAGERRLKAAKLAGLPTVPAIIRSISLERERLEMAIIENLQRENLNPIERGRAFARLQDEFSLTQREIATRLGKSRAAVANTVRLLDLPSYIQTALSNNQISESHGRLLLGISDEKSREQIFKDLVDTKLTTRELKGQVAKARDGNSSFTIDLSPEIKMFQEELTSQLGAPVKIDQRGEGGKITITFYSDEELQSIIDRFKKNNEEEVGW